ncbi:hypothetical protein NCER_100688 [Vairimorpha ceranae BRL01]|uniref:separase n=1 Tax=Vairimorpha ceranae (strain BRL01) TaxID=578460 RepID=C4V880_VAIC1|nr:hypothetical protein NCER_100688 [Vairimorpha ceranae BRL01]
MTDPQIIIRKASERLNHLMKDITYRSTKEAYEIIKNTLPFAKHYLPQYTYEKCMLRFLSKLWDENIFNLLSDLISKITIVNKETANIFIPYCIIKFNRFNVLDKKYINFLDFCDEKYNKKFQVILKKSNSAHVKSLVLNKHGEEVSECKIKKNLQDNFFTEFLNICNFKVIDKECDRDCFYTNYNKRIIYNFTGDKFSKVVHLFVKKRYKQCKLAIKELLKEFYEYLHVYNILIYCYIQLGMYQEAIYYLNICIDMSNKKVRWYFINYKLLVERIGFIQGPTSYLKNIELNDDYFITNLEHKTQDIKNHSNLSVISNDSYTFNKKLVFNRLSENFKDIIREIRNIDNAVKININIKDNIKVISIFVLEEMIHIAQVTSGCYKVYNTNINYKMISLEYNGILLKNKDILKNETKKEIWWAERIKLDRIMKNLMEKINFSDLKITGTVFLIFDEKTEEFPFEHTSIFKNALCYRISSIEHIEDLDRKNYCSLNNSTLLLDPDLKNTFERITANFKDKKTKLIEHNMNAEDKFICYFGHGSGTKYISKNIKNSVLFLFGCSSARLVCTRNFNKNGDVKKFIKNNKNVLGCLYEVTDKDLDIFSINLLNQEGNVAELIKKSKLKMKLKYLNGCSIVIYGASLYIKNH